MRFELVIDEGGRFCDSSRWRGEVIWDAAGELPERLFIAGALPGRLVAADALPGRLFVMGALRDGMFCVAVR